jgi:5-methyltetrahydropteroyltriglutamate--homocysteine methyltransferase
MPHHRKYTTTVVGAHSVPRWYEALDRLVTLGQLSPADFAVAQYRATQAAILEQEIAGIDVITGGEMHRRTHNRHAPRSSITAGSIPASRSSSSLSPIPRSQLR